MLGLQGAFSRGVKRETVASNPFDGVKLPRVQAKTVRIFKPHEIDAMVAVAPDLWWEALIRDGYTSGLRLGEMLILTWADVDFDGETVTVQTKRPRRSRWGIGRTQFSAGPAKATRTARSQCPPRP